MARFHRLGKFVEFAAAGQVLARGETKSSILLPGGLQADLRLVERESFGAALQYFTGSKQHNIRLREMAVRAGLKINEYGIFRGDKSLAGLTERDVYQRVGLPFIELIANRSPRRLPLDQYERTHRAGDVRAKKFSGRSRFRTGPHAPS